MTADTTSGTTSGTTSASASEPPPPRRFRVVGAGKAGRSIAGALASVGWQSAGLLGRNDDPSDAASDVALLILAVPDHAIAPVAAAITPGPAVVIHLAGSRPLTDLAPHTLIASLHPLVSLPNPATGAQRLLDSAVFALAGHPIVNEIVAQFGGRPVTVADDQRALYHATASVAANHLVALCAQVERLAEQVGVPVDAYWGLMTNTLGNVTTSNATAALTGPASRADWETIGNHLAALPPSEHDLYTQLSRAAAELGGHEWLGERPSPSIEQHTTTNEGRP